MVPSGMFFEAAKRSSCASSASVNVAVTRFRRTPSGGPPEPFGRPRRFFTPTIAVTIARGLTLAQQFVNPGASGPDSGSGRPHSA